MKKVLYLVILLVASSITFSSCVESDDPLPEPELMDVESDPDSDDDDPDNIPPPGQ